MPIFCPSCNTELEEGSVVCSNCGNPVDAVAGEAEEINNKEAISKLFKEAQSKINTADNTAENVAENVAEEESLDEIPEDVLNDFNTGKAVDLSISEAAESGVDDMLFDESQFDLDNIESEEYFDEEEEETVEKESVIIKIAETKDDVMFGPDGERLQINKQFEQTEENADFLTDGVYNAQAQEEEQNSKKKRGKRAKKAKKSRAAAKNSDDDDTDVDNQIKRKKAKPVKEKKVRQRPVKEKKPKGKGLFGGLGKRTAEESASSPEADIGDNPDSADAFDLLDLQSDEGAGNFSLLDDSITAEPFNLADELLSPKSKNEPPEKENALFAFFAAHPLFGRALIFILAAAVSFTLGAAVIYLQYDAHYKIGPYDDAYDAARVVKSRIPKDYQLIIYDIYVKEGAAETESIVIGALSNEVGAYESTYYRIIRTESEITIYYPFDEAEYGRLLAGSDQDKISADILFGRHQKYLAALAEINSGNEKWKRINGSFINLQIN